MGKKGGARGQARPSRGSNPKAGGKRRAGGAIDDEELEEMMLDDVDRFHKKAEDRIALDGGAEEGSSDNDDDEEGVFDLDVDDDDDDDDDDDEGDDDEADEDDEGHGDEGTTLGAKLGKKANAVRGVESGGLLSDEEESSEDEDDASRKLLKWGKAKQAYYNADATDLEIGQDFKEAEEEEAAAREVEQARYDELDDEDFGLDDVEDEDERDGSLGARLKTGREQERASSGTKRVKGTPGQARSLDISGDVETTHLPRNLSKLSKAGMLQVLLSEAPELLTLLEEFKEKLSELKERVEPLVPLARQGAANMTDDGVAYLEVKQQLLLSYCINITYYMLLKVEGKSVKDHPVIDHLLELRAALEKMRPLDNKLKYSIDRLLKVADRNAEQDARDPLSFRPDPEALLGKDRVEELDGASDEVTEAADGVYRAPRLAAVPYDEMESGKKAKQEEKARKNLAKLRRSEIMQSLTEQYSEKPEVVVDRSMSEKERRKLEEAEERRRYEEERFVRLATTKKDRKEQKMLQRESTRLETIADIGDFHDLEESLAALNASGTLSGAANGLGVEDNVKKRSATDALQRAVNSLAQREQAKRRKRGEAVGDADVPFMNRDALEASRSSGGVDELLDEPRPKKSKKPRGEPVEEQTMDFDDLEVEDDPLYDAVAARKAKKRAEKEALYAVEPTYTPMEDELDDAMKRGIDSSILKNRGLTPYKSKLNRNPRVKKREAYRKAVIRRKGQVRDVRDSEGGFYGGETTGINAKVVRTRKPGRKP